MIKLNSYVGIAFNRVIETLTAITLPIEQKMLVLNHGDAWNNNVLFHKNPKTGELDDVVLFDLQVTIIYVYKKFCLPKSTCQ